MEMKMKNRKSVVISPNTLSKKNLINALEPREISSEDEATEIGAKMAKAVAKKLKLSLCMKEKA